MFFLIVGGFFISYPSIKAEFFPTPDPKAVDRLEIVAGPRIAEGEAALSWNIEERLEGVSGLKMINSN